MNKEDTDLAELTRKNLIFHLERARQAVSTDPEIGEWLWCYHLANKLSRSMPVEIAGNGNIRRVVIEDWLAIEHVMDKHQLRQFSLEKGEEIIAPAFDLLEQSFMERLCDNIVSNDYTSKIPAKSRACDMFMAEQIFVTTPDICEALKLSPPILALTLKICGRAGSLEYGVIGRHFNYFSSERASPNEKTLVLYALAEVASNQEYIPFKRWRTALKSHGVTRRAIKQFMRLTMNELETLRPDIGDPAPLSSLAKNLKLLQEFRIRPERGFLQVLEAWKEIAKGLNDPAGKDLSRRMRRMVGSEMQRCQRFRRRNQYTLQVSRKIIDAVDKHWVLWADTPHRGELGHDS